MRPTPLLTALGVLSACILAAAGLSSPRPGTPSCATFVLSQGSTLLVGHNLDESGQVPGLIVVNPHGLAKENVTYGDLTYGRSSSARRLTWVSRYGSLTYNVFGREFPDGGVNEAGLYVGEMTLMQTAWPSGDSLPRLYHHQWMQYLLDTCANVDEALATLSRALPEGHCRWHFLLADRGGNAAVVEFLDGKPTVRTGTALPYRILCNDPYAAELEDIVRYQGFGGTRPPEPRYEREDPRFRWAAVMLARYDGTTPAVAYAFEVLKRLDVGSNRWAIVSDLANGRVYVRTSLASRIRWLDLGSAGFACAQRTRALDINRDNEGDVAGQLAVLNDEWNREAIGRAWANVDAGFFGNLLFKPRMVAGLRRAGAGFSCQER